MKRARAAKPADPWCTACPDWEQRIRTGRSLIPELPLFSDEADKAARVFDQLRLPDVAGLPFFAEAAGDWFRQAVRALFGSYDPDTGVRHISELFVLVPKKNSKTTNGAGLMLTAMFRSYRPRAEFLLIGPTQEVAELAFRQAVGMIEADPILMEKCHIQEHIRRIGYRPTGAFLKIKSFDPRVVTGSKPAGVLLDETHVIANMHDADRVIGQLRGGLLSQPEGFLAQITTQSERAPAGVFAQELRKARAVRDGKLAAPLLPLLYEFPPGADWRDEANWPMVLPNLGRSINMTKLAQGYRAAVADGNEELRRWASQHLNVEIGLALLSNSWAGAEYWTAGGARRVRLRDILERCDGITIGIDGGGLDDLMGLAVLGRERDTGHWLAWLHAWVHPIAFERHKANAPTYRDFEQDGDLTICGAVGDDVAAVVAIVCTVQDTGCLVGVGVDPVGIGEVLNALAEAGIDPELVKGVQQGWRLNGAIKTVERALAASRLHHDGTRLGAWCAGNARVEPRGNAILVTKEASGAGKIDPLMALFNATVLMELSPAPGRSFWQEPAAQA